jgi:transcriptional regulator with XRE-family HTH domain
MFGSKLHALLKKHDLKQKDLVDICHTSESNISRWINAEYPPLDFIHDICNYFKIPLWQFFIDENDSFESIRPPYMSDMDDEILRVLNMDISEADRIIIHRICRDAIQLALGRSISPDLQ